MYRAPEQGGLGTFCLRNFLQAQKCIWIARAVRYPIDNWQHNLVNAAPDRKAYLIRPIDIDINAHPLLYGLAVSYRHFYGEFTKAYGNYHYAYIRGGRFLDFLDFQPVATGSRCKMLF
jgi:hypothetical protein